MRDENIKEQISRFAFCLLAARMGCKIRTFNLDDGVDLGFEKLIDYRLNGDAWSVHVGDPVDVQLKCTTRSQVAVKDKFLKFDLKRKNFNDLVARKKLREQGMNNAPMILALLVLPDDPKEWVSVLPAEESIGMKGVFYWYLPSTSDFTKNDNRQRIDIPLSNTIDLAFFNEVPKLLHRQK